MSAPPIPAIIVASVHHEGEAWTLTLCRTHYHRAGTCILEQLEERDADGEPSSTELIEFGGWIIQGRDGRPAALSIDVECGTPEEVEDWPALRRALLREALKQAEDWGAATFED